METNERIAVLERMLSELSSKLDYLLARTNAPENRQARTPAAVAQDKCIIINITQNAEAEPSFYGDAFEMDNPEEGESDGINR